MTAQILDGNVIASKYKAQIKNEISELIKDKGKQPCLAVILVGDDPASTIYVKNKTLASAEVQIKSCQYRLPATTNENDLLTLIKQLNTDNDVHGILVQLPLPEQINTAKVLECVNPLKDVDGFHPYNMGKLVESNPVFRPCTPFGIMLLLGEINISLIGKHAVIIGASNIVGKPIMFELLNAGCTVTICHRQTKELEKKVSMADILVVATGNKHLVKGAWVKQDAVVIDVGINRLDDGSIVGDVEFAEAQKRASWITPVPGGVGPMTIVALLKNTLVAYSLNN